jgi:hypothetical protein
VAWHLYLLLQSSVLWALGGGGEHFPWEADEANLMSAQGLVEVEDCSSSICGCRVNLKNRQCEQCVGQQCAIT